MSDNQSCESLVTLQDELKELQLLGKQMEIELRNRGYGIYCLQSERSLVDIVEKGRLLGEVLCETTPNYKTRLNAIAEELTRMGYEGCDENKTVVDIHQVQRVMDRECLRAREATSLVNVRELPGENDDFELGSIFHQEILSSIASGKAKSPFHLAACIQKDAKQNKIKHLIQSQFKIKWDTDTPNGEPDDFEYFTFCKACEGVANVSSFQVRKAHILVQLYRVSRLLNPTSLVRVTKETLCPPVYVRTSDSGFLRWNVYNPSEPLKIEQLNNFDDHFSWMNDNIRGYIKKNADERNSLSWKEDLADKHTLYWAVVEETEMERNEVGRTQVYVGKTHESGILKHWIDGHCMVMKKCLDATFNMKTYSPLKVSSLLVDARLLLTKLRNVKENRTVENCALFVMKIFDNEDYENKEAIKNAVVEEEKKHINGKIDIGLGVGEWSPKNMNSGMNG